MTAAGAHRRRLVLVFGLTLAVLLVEVIGALASGSLALLADAGHLFTDTAGIGLALYAVCVYPANVNHMLIDLARPSQGLGMAYHVPRLLAQPLLVWLALWVGEVIEWPRLRSTR